MNYTVKFDNTRNNICELLDKLANVSHNMPWTFQWLHLFLNFSSVECKWTSDCWSIRNDFSALDFCNVSYETEGKTNVPEL